MSAHLKVHREIGFLAALTVVGALGFRDLEASSRASVQEEIAEKTQKPDLVIKPELEKCTLEVGRQVLKPIHTATPSFHEERVGDTYIRVSKDQVTAIRVKDSRQLWSAKAPSGQHLHWLDGQADIAYFLGYEVDTEGRFSRFETPPRVHRLDLKNGRWLPDLAPETPKERSIKEILAVLAGVDRVIMLSTLTKAGVGDREMPVSDYLVTCFQSGKATPQWSKTFPSSKERPGPGVYLWASRKPDYAASGLRHLAWLGDTLLVCPEDVYPILCLNPDTGTKIWQLDRPWEIERGFSGPSMWMHQIGRFRLDSFDEIDPQKIERARQAFDKQFECALIGGPAVASMSPGNKIRFFLAVSKGPANHLSGYISDCILYEFNEEARPVSLLKLPQMVRGSRFQVLKNGVAWKCQNQSFFKVVPSPEYWRLGMGPGGPDLLTRMPWFRQLTAKDPDAWLVADRAGDPVAFSNTHSFGIPAGGYVKQKDESIYHFPLSALDLETAVEHSLLLNVPFKGELPLPKNNYSQTTKDGRSSVHTLGPYVLAITDVQGDTRALEITLGMENWSAVVTFDLGNTDLVGAAPAAEVGPDPIKTWLAALGDVNKENERGATPLEEAAGRDDSRYVKALLEAGANPRIPTKDGQTPLMNAAAYGTAETVQLLIDAGADVNPRDKKDGETILMLAIRSQQSKKKVKALIKAGADTKATNSDGENLLLIAASWGDLPMVELLLQAGFDISSRSKNGETALILAASHGQRHSVDNLISVLLKAGANVNARDNKGKTVFMRAVDGSCSLDGLRLLLESGADPQMKDQDGQTALDLAKASNSYDSKLKAEFLEKIKRRKEK